jgi:hypothetical protein
MPSKAIKMFFPDFVGSEKMSPKPANKRPIRREAIARSLGDFSENQYT